MIEQIVAIFDANRHLWSRDGVYFSPEDSDVEAVIEEGVRLLSEEDSGNQYERGGIIVQRTNNHYDVYVHLGEA